MRYAGRLTDWHDDKGYGFVLPHGGGERAFVHIKAFERPGRRPAVGDLVSYAVARDTRGRLNAVQLRFAGARAASARSGRAPSFRVPRTPLALLAGGGLALLAWARVLPAAVLFGYTVASGVTFLAYAWDKAAAERGAWRTSEDTLHGLALLGGWPGALLAQGMLRHKSRKASFQWVFWASVVLNCAALAWWLRRGG